MRIKKRKPIIFIRSSHFPQKPLCNDIYPHFEPPAQGKTHQFAIQLILTFGTDAFTLCRQQFLQDGVVFLLINLVQIGPIDR